jgi:glucose-6-phosphate 1-dehydrogenase
VATETEQALSPNPLLAGLSSERRAPPLVLVVFGASGDLASRKLFPALERLASRRQLPAAFSVVGVARTEMTDEEFRDLCRKAVSDAGPSWEGLVSGFRYVCGE